MKSSKGKAILISIGAWVLIVIILIMRIYLPFFAFFTVCDVIDSFTKTPIIDVVTVDKGDVLDKYDIDILKSDVIKNKSIEKNYYRIYLSIIYFKRLY